MAKRDASKETSDKAMAACTPTIRDISAVILVKDATLLLLLLTKTSWVFQREQKRISTREVDITSRIPSRARLDKEDPDSLPNR